jgi:hypothetical protein
MGTPRSCEGSDQVSRKSQTFPAGSISSLVTEVRNAGGRLRTSTPAGQPGAGASSISSKSLGGAGFLPEDPHPIAATSTTIVERMHTVGKEAPALMLSGTGGGVTSLA